MIAFLFEKRYFHTKKFISTKLEKLRWTQTTMRLPCPVIDFVAENNNIILRSSGRKSKNIVFHLTSVPFNFLSLK